MSTSFTNPNMKETYHIISRNTLPRIPLTCLHCAEIMFYASLMNFHFANLITHQWPSPHRHAQSPPADEWWAPQRAANQQRQQSYIHRHLVPKRKMMWKRSDSIFGWMRNNTQQEPIGTVFQPIHQPPTPPRSAKHHETSRRLLSGRPHSAPLLISRDGIVSLLCFVNYTQWEYYKICIIVVGIKWRKDLFMLSNSVYQMYIVHPSTAILSMACCLPSPFIRRCSMYITSHPMLSTIFLPIS